MRLRAPSSRRRPKRLLDELEASDGYVQTAYATDASTRSTRSQPVQTIDPRLRPAFPPPTKPFNPNLPSAPFPSLSVDLPGPFPHATQDQQPQQQNDNPGEDSERPDFTALSRRRAIILRYRLPTEEDKMDPEKMTLAQLVRREYNMRVSEHRLYAVDDKSPAFQSTPGLDPHASYLNCSSTEKGQVDDMSEEDPVTAFTKLHHLMRATIIVNTLSESMRLWPERDIFWPIRLLLRAERSILYGDLNYIVDMVLKDKYPYILGDLQAEMDCAQKFLEHSRLPIRFLYAFKLENVKEVLELPDATFAVPNPKPNPNIDIKDFAPDFEPPIAPDTTLDLSGSASKDLLANGPYLLKGATEAAMKRSDPSTPEEATEHTVACTSSPMDQSPSSAPQKPLPKEDSVIPRNSEAPDAAHSKSSDSVEPEINVEAADAATAMDIDAASTKPGNQTESEVDHEASITDKLRNQVAQEATKPNEKDEDWFEEMPSPILRGMNLSMQPGLAPESSYGHSFTDAVYYDERFLDLFPYVDEPSSSKSSGLQQTSEAEPSTQNAVAKPSEKITAAVDFTEIFSEVADQHTKLKYNLVLNHLLGLGEEIREATLRESRSTPMRGGEDMNIDVEVYDRMDMVGEETPHNSSSLSLHFGELLPAATNTTPVAVSQFPSGFFPRSLRSLPPRFVLPRRQSSGNQNVIEASALQGGLNSSPATIAATDPNSSPGILLPFPRPSQPFRQRTQSRKGKPLKRMTMTGTSTPRRDDHQEPPSSAATIPMVDSNPSPGILLLRNQQTPHRRQQARRRQNHGGSPLKHVTTSQQPSKMCSSSSSTESSSSSKSSSPEPPVPKSNFLSERISKPPLAAFRLRPDSSSKPLSETTLVVSNSGRDAGLASVRTTKSSRDKKSKNNIKDLGLSSASLDSAGTLLPISAPGYANIRLPDRTAIKIGLKTAPLPSTFSISSWAAEQEARARANRSSFSRAASNGNSGFHPMHPMMQPPFSAVPASTPPTPRKNTISTNKSLGQSHDGGKCAEEISGRWRGGGNSLDWLQKFSAGRLEMEAKQSNAGLPRSLAPDPLSAHNSSVESDAPAPEVASGAGDSASNPQRTGTATGEIGKVGGEDHGEQDVDDSPCQVDSLSPVSSGGGSADEEFDHQQQLDEKPEQRRQAERQEQQRPAEPPVPDYPFPLFPPWGKVNTGSASIYTTPASKRRRSGYALNAAGDVEMNSPFTHSAYSPFRLPRPPGEETTPGILAPPIRPGRKRSLSQYLKDSASVGDGGTGGNGTRDV